MDKTDVDTCYISCQPCMADGKQVVPSFYCIDCNECHCLRCKEAHRRFSFMKGHLIVNIEPTLTQRHINRFHKYCMCKVHDMKIEFICSNDDVLCCTNCKHEKHKSCTNMQDIGRIAENDPLEFFRLKGKADRLRNEVMTMSKYIKETNETLNNGSAIEKLQNTLHDMKKNLLKRIDCFINTMLEEGRRGIESKLENDIKREELSEQIIATLDELMEDIDRWNQAPVTQKFILMHRLTEQFKEFEEKAKSISAYLRSPGEFFLSLDNKMESLVNYKFSFGSVYLRDDSVPINKITDHRALRAELVDTKSLRRRALDQTEFVPDITGMSFLDDGRLVVIDKMNRHIRVREKSLLAIKWKTEYTPTDVVSLEDCKFIVIFPRILVFYKIRDDELYIYKKIPTQKENDTISIKDKSTYIIGVSGDKIPALLLTESGNEVDLNLQLSDCSSYHSKSLFFKTRVTEFLAISFKDFNLVILEDMQTKEMQSICNDELIKPGYMCIGHLDTLFVCCESGKVVQLTTEGAVLAVLRTDIPEPKCIATSKDKKELAIAGNGKILTYKILHV